MLPVAGEDDSYLMSVVVPNTLIGHGVRGLDDCGREKRRKGERREGEKGGGGMRER